MEKEIDLIFERLQEVFNWTSETVTQLYPIVLQEYQIYNVLELISCSFGIILSVCIAILVIYLLYYWICLSDYYVEEQTKLKAKKNIKINIYIALGLMLLTIIPSILQILLSPHYHMFTQLM